MLGTIDIIHICQNICIQLWRVWIEYTRVTKNKTPVIVVGWICWNLCAFWQIWTDPRSTVGGAKLISRTGPGQVVQGTCPSTLCSYYKLLANYNYVSSFLQFLEVFTLYRIVPCWYKSHKRWGMSDRPGKIIVGPGSEKDKSLIELVVPECVAVSRSPY